MKEIIKEYYLKGYESGINAARAEIEEIKIAINKDMPANGFNNLGIADFNYKTGCIETLSKLETRLANIINKSESK